MTLWDVKSKGLRGGSTISNVHVFKVSKAHSQPTTLTLTISGFFFVVMKPESPGPPQTNRLPPVATASSPAYSMSVIVIILTAFAAAVLLIICILACHRRKKQWRNRKRSEKRWNGSLFIRVSTLSTPLTPSFPPQSDGDPDDEHSSVGAPAGSTAPQPHVPAGSPAAELKAAGPRVSTE